MPVAGAAPFVPDQPTRSNLREAVLTCRGCELYEDATQAVMGAGPADATVMLLGEQPGDKEDLRGEPFVGPAGQLLVKALAATGADPARFYRTNVVKHFRFESRGKARIHKTPGVTHLTACRPWLTAELSVVAPRGVVLLGATAAKAVMGRDFRLTQQRGVLMPWPELSADPVAQPPEWTLATLHPSAVLRADDRDTAYDGLVSDLRIAVERARATG